MNITPTTSTVQIPVDTQNYYICLHDTVHKDAYGLTYAAS